VTGAGVTLPVMALIAPRDRTGAAAALVRAGLLDDPEAGVLIARQNGSVPRTDGQPGSDELVFSLMGLAVKALLSAAGGDAGVALGMIDRWIAMYDVQAATRVQEAGP
jgi:hypothetical protein